MNDSSIRFLQKIIFIYNAVINGWTVNMVDGEFKFTKDSQYASTENLNDFLKASIQIPEELKQITESIPQSLEKLI